MNTAQPNFEHVWPLIEAACLGTISDRQARELQEALRGNVELQRVYLEYCRMHAELRCLLRAAPTNHVVMEAIVSGDECARADYSPPLSVSSRLESGWQGATGWLVDRPLAVGYLVATACFFVAAIVGSVIYVAHGDGALSVASRDAEMPIAAREKLEYVGKITGLANCRWAEQSVEAPRGALIPLGKKLHLDAGLVEITYSTGARVILEGPCKYEVDSATGGYLAVGKLIARVEAGSGESGNRGVGESGSRENRSGDSTSPAPLFAICTPSAIVTDLGTEFGVIVGEDGDTATHMIEGRVELKVLDDDRPEHQAIRIAAGESVHVERPAKDTKDGLAAVARGKADADLFPVHPGKLTEYVAEKRLEPFRRWQAFSDELCKRDDLVDYWDFQRDKKNPLVLRNRAPGGHDGTIEGARWVPGRLPGKQALRFSYPSHRVRVRISDKIEGSSQVTLAAWVCNEDVAKPMASLLGDDDRLAPGSVSWRWHIQKSMPIIAEGRWSFMVSTKDLEKNKGAFYFNGELSNETGSPRPGYAHSKVLAPHGCMIGNSYVTNAQLLTDIDRSFKGSIGELMIFNKVLSPDEIGRIYEKGTATPSDKADSAIGEQP